MAEITTHVFLAKDIKNRINCNDSIKIFSLGPDAFFFSNKTKPLGNYMHRNKTLLFFKNYIKYIKENKLEKNDYVLGSLFGFLSHYVLDYMVHPYIFYFDHLNKDMHRMYEMSLTKNILKLHNANNYKLFNEIKCDKNKEIIKLLNYVFKETFNYENYGLEYYKSINRVRRVYRIFRYDRFGIKKGFYKIIDLFSKRKISLISFHNIKDANMNFDYKKWNHPCNIREKHNESLIDLYYKSIDITINIINEIELVLEDKKDINYLDNVINNYSYVTGKNCDELHRFISFYN